MEKTNRIEEQISRKMLNFLNTNGLPIEQSAKFVYEITYLTLLSVRTIKEIINYKDVSLEEFINKYSSYLTTLVKEDINWDNNLEVSFSNYEECLNIANEILDCMRTYSYSLKNIFPLLSVLCSYNGLVLKNILSLDLFSGSRFINPTPNQLCKIINYILDVNKNDDVFDICSAYGNYLIDAGFSDCESLSGIEINQELGLISKIRLSALNSGKFNIVISDLFNIEPERKFDKVFCNFPWNLRYDKYQLDYLSNITNYMKFNWGKISNNSLDWLFIDYLVSSLKSNGKGAAIMIGGSLFKVSDEIYRKELVDNGLVESVIKLPILTTFTSVEQYLVVFSENNEKINFIDISKTVNKNGFNRFDLDIKKVFSILNFEDQNKFVTLSKEEIAENGYVLTVDNYVGKKEISYHNPVVLSDCINDSFRGYQMTSKEQEELESPEGKYEILMISDIENGMISDELKKIDNEEAKYERYLLKQNDIIISSKGTRIKIAVVGDIKDRKIIANGNLIVLRPDVKKLNPYYLEMYLNSEDGQTILNQIQTGSVIISINPSRLIEIKIDMLPIEKQNALAEKYNMKQKQYLMAKDHLRKLEEEQNCFYESEVLEMFD